MLRESSRAKKEDYDLTLLTGTEGDGNIPHGALLVAFTDAVVLHDTAETTRLRGEIRSQMGDDALVDAAAIVAAFSGFTRIADSTGIPLEDAKAEGFTKLAYQFAAVADIEKHHEERYNQLSKNIEDGAVFFRNGKTYWQCRNCGYIVEADSAPSVCPVCAHPQAFFQINMINY